MRVLSVEALVHPVVRVPLRVEDLDCDHLAADRIERLDDAAHRPGAEGGDGAIANRMERADADAQLRA